MLKLIASDLDGTLLQNGAQSLESPVFEYIHSLTKSGYLFVAASGRQYANLQRLFFPVKDEIAYICENGSLVIYKGEIIKKSVIEKTLGEKILASFQKIEDCEILLSGIDTSYIQPKKESYLTLVRDIVKNNVTVVDNIFHVEEPYIKISAYHEKGISQIPPCISEYFSDKVTIVTSGNGWLDTMPLRVNKGTAIKALGDFLCISPSEMMAVGDNYNDMEMLQTVGFSVAMDNAVPEVLSACRYSISDVCLLFDKLLSGKLTV